MPAQLEIAVSGQMRGLARQAIGGGARHLAALVLDSNQVTLLYFRQRLRTPETIVRGQDGRASRAIDELLPPSGTVQ